MDHSDDDAQHLQGTVDALYMHRLSRLLLTWSGRLSPSRKWASGDWVKEGTRSRSPNWQMLWLEFTNFCLITGPLLLFLSSFKIFSTLHQIFKKAWNLTFLLWLKTIQQLPISLTLKSSQHNLKCASWLISPTRLGRIWSFLPKILVLCPLNTVFLLYSNYWFFFNCSIFTQR